MSNKIKDITGEVFNYLTVLSIAGRDKYNAVLWLCKCRCGNEKITTISALRAGRIKSCGCIKKDISKTKIKRLDNKQERL